MFKKFVSILLLAFCAGFTANPVLAQNAETQNLNILAAFDQEAPFNEADVQTFIKIAPALMEAVDANDEAKAITIMADAGWNEIRGAYVTSKIGNGYVLLTDPEDAETLFDLVQMPASLIPGEAEMALIRKNEAELGKIFQ